MLARIVDWSLDNRPLVLILAALVVLGGGHALTRLPIDAVPDVTNVQVQVLTKAPALGPAEMEQFVTYPIEAAMNGLPDLVEIRSVSRYGLSAVTIVFQDHVNVYFARQLVNERLSQAREAIPPGFGNPEMGPVSTGLGEVFMFDHLTFWIHLAQMFFHGRRSRDTNFRKSHLFDCFWRTLSTHIAFDDTLPTNFAKR